MKSIYFHLLVLMATLAFYACSSDINEEPTLGAIVGSVSDNTTGEPVATAKISITPSGSSTVTGSDGSFSFVNLEPGEYNIAIQKENYNSKTTEVRVRAGEPSEVHLTIERKPASLTADKNLLDFGESLATLSFTIVNSGYTDLAYKVEKGDCEWLSIEPEMDILGYGKTATIVVNLNRSKLPSGTNEANIVVRSTSGNGNVEIKVTATNNANGAVNTLDVTDITKSTATLNGEITNPGTPVYTERGFVYDIQPNPSVSDCIKKYCCPIKLK